LLTTPTLEQRYSEQAAQDFQRSWRRRVVTLLVVEAESELDPAAAKFQEQLAALKREFGFCDETDIFSPDISEPSKMKAMKLPLVPGADPHSRAGATRRESGRSAAAAARAHYAWRHG
jgi:hypothetical protein